jgi:hypothetical protein
MKKVKRDFIIKLRVAKNRMDLMSDMLVEEIGEFEMHDENELFFRKILQMMHKGELNAFKDLINTYLAKSYLLGVKMGEKGGLYGLSDREYLCRENSED